MHKRVQSDMHMKRVLLRGACTGGEEWEEQEDQLGCTFSNQGKWGWLIGPGWRGEGGDGWWGFEQEPTGYT